MTKKPNVADGTIYSRARRADQVREHTITCEKRQQQLHEVSARKRSRLESLAQSGTSHIYVKAEDVVQDSGSRQFLANVVISYAESDSALLMETRTKYCHIQDVRFLYFLKMLEAVGVTPTRRMKSLFSDPSYNVQHGGVKPETPLKEEFFLNMKTGDMLHLVELVLRSGGNEFFFLPYNLRTVPAPCKNARKRYNSLQTKLNTQKYKETVSILRTMI